jgi:toxin YoeB
MKVIFTEASWTDYLWFQENDRKLLNRINNLIKEIKRNPFAGIGKPEPLRANLRGYWLNMTWNRYTNFFTLRGYLD